MNIDTPALDKLLSVRQFFLVGDFQIAYHDNWPVEWESEPTIGLIRAAKKELEMLKELLNDSN